MAGVRGERSTSGSRAPIDLPFGGGTATSIGSLPHTDVDLAVELVLRSHADLPAAPELPRRRADASMVNRWALAVDGIEVDAAGKLVVADGLDEDAAIRVDLTHPPHGGLLRFLDAVADRTAPIKVQVTGPVTLSQGLVAAGVPRRTASLLGARLAEAAASAVGDAARERAPRAPLVGFVDEPGLVHVAHPRFSIARRQLVAMVRRALAAYGDGVVTGVHCCGATDWRLVVAVRAHILSLPVDVLTDDDLGPIASHLGAGGWVAWGAIPTDAPVGELGHHSWERLAQALCDLGRIGVDPLVLRRQALVTPACGLAGHGELQAARILDVAVRLGQRLRDESSAARFALGA